MTRPAILLKVSYKAFQPWGLLALMSVLS